MANRVEYELSLRDFLSAKIDAANTSVNRLEKSLGSTRGSVVNLGSALGVTFGIAGIVAFTKNMISAGTTVENALTGLTTLLKSSSEAKQVIDNTMSDASKTPFGFDGLLAANKALISAGSSAQEARTDVLNLANAIAATGGGDDELQRMVVNLQQIKNTGEATALDIKQFAYAGININKLLEAAGIKVTKGNKDQKISYEQITEALKKAHEAGGIYANGLENMSENTSVKISNLKDAVFQLSAKMFKDLKPAIESVVKWLFKFIKLVRKAWDWAVKYKDIIKKVAIALGEAWIAFKTIGGAVSIINRLGNAFSSAASNGVSSFSNSIAGAIGKVNALIAVVTSARIVGDFLADLSKQGTKKGEERMTAGEDAKDEENKKLEGLIAGKKAKEIIKILDKEISSKDSKYWEFYNASLAAKNDYARYDLYDKAQVEASRKKAAIDFKKQWESTSLVPSKKAQEISNKTSTSGSRAAGKTKAVGSKSVTINVKINHLIGTYNSNITNIKEMSNKVKDIVVQALTGAVNDFQVVAGDI